MNPADQYDKTTWPQLKARFAALFASQSRDHWCALLEGSDACFAPVLSIEEAAEHPHNVARCIYSKGADGRIEAAPAPLLRPRVDMKCGQPLCRRLPSARFSSATRSELRVMTFESTAAARRLAIIALAMSAR